MNAQQLTVQFEKLADRVTSDRKYLDEVVKDAKSAADKLAILQKDFEREVALLKRSCETAEAQLKSVEAVLARLTETEKQLALVQLRLDDMKLNWEKWVVRVWSLAGPLVGIALAYILGLKK